jgi:23S rRNA pseudouridine2605 synthase
MATKKAAANKPVKKATRKTKKQAEAEAAQVEAFATPAPQREPDEPELNAASQAAVGASEEKPEPAAAPVATEPEAELLAEAADTFEQAYDEPPSSEPRENDEPGADAAVSTKAKTELRRETHEYGEPEPAAERSPGRLERLQKILSQAGVASRRHAEEMIVEGRVQVNGTVVTELGSKADPDRDHIRVDGKLLRGAERLRYFVLNKPKGYVTTVSDPEGRPTVMEFFKKMSERLYPVGRLDYLSEGLLLVTNDGDLANKLTKAATGVEKSYLVKVSGQPTEEELDRLREGVAIDRGRPGEGQVHTAPSTIRLARAGDNPWYEVVLTEGRNRELRKMFEEIGHHVEKIRRVGYGPLVLDVEPGQFRELEPEELNKLRLAAEGKWRKPKPKESRPEARREGRYEGRREAGRGARPGPRSEPRPDAGREMTRREPARGAGAARQRRPDDRGQAGERPDRRPAQRAGQWAERRDQTSPRPRFQPTERGKEFGRPPGGRPPAGGRPVSGGRPPRGGKPERAGHEWPRRQTSGRTDRPAATSGYQRDRPRFQDRDDRGGPGQKPRRGPAPPPGRFDSVRAGRPTGAGRPAGPPGPMGTGRPVSTGRPGFAGREQTGGGAYRGGASRGGFKGGGRTAGRPNRAGGPGRPSGPGRSSGPRRTGSGPGRPPFKGGSGTSQPRSDAPRGPRGRRS